MPKNQHILTITDPLGNEQKLRPRLELYSVNDFMGEAKYGLAIVLDTVAYPPEEVEQYAVLTASFGEFIGLKDCAYIDVNNCPFADQLLAQGIAESTPYTKQSGFCTYPLWHFKGDFLKDIGASNYEKYSAGYKYENDEGDNESYIDDGDEGMDLS